MQNRLEDIFKHYDWIPLRGLCKFFHDIYSTKVAFFQRN